jgi:hypothetical protein
LIIRLIWLNIESLGDLTRRVGATGNIKDERSP